MNIYSYLTISLILLFLGACVMGAVLLNKYAKFDQPVSPQTSRECSKFEYIDQNLLSRLILLILIILGWPT